MFLAAGLAVGCQQIIRVFEMVPPIHFGPAKRTGEPIIMPTEPATEGSD